MTEDEMAGWHHRLNGHEFEQAPGVGDGRGGLGCCRPWRHKESDRTECRTASEAPSELTPRALWGQPYRLRTVSRRSSLFLWTHRLHAFPRSCRRKLHQLSYQCFPHL